LSGPHAAVDDQRVHRGAAPITGAEGMDASPLEVRDGRALASEVARWAEVIGLGHVTRVGAEHERHVKPG
jgi:hypothetical protein